MGAKERAYLPHAVVEVTTDCNLRCKHCYNWWKREGEAPPARGAFGKAFRLLEWLISHTTAEQVVFSGGEPTLCERFEELALHAKVNGLRVTVITNGNGPGRVYEALARMGGGPAGVLCAVRAGGDARRHHGRGGVVGADDAGAAAGVGAGRGGGARDGGDGVERRRGGGVSGDAVRDGGAAGDGEPLQRRGRGVAAGAESVAGCGDAAAGVPGGGRAGGAAGAGRGVGVCTPHCLLDPEEYPHVRFGSCGTEAYRRPLTFDVEGNVRMCNHSPRVMGNVYRQPLEEILFSDYACSWESGRAAFCEECGRGERCRGGCRAAAEQVGGTLRDADPVTRELSLKPFNC